LLPLRLIYGLESCGNTEFASIFRHNRFGYWNLLVERNGDLVMREEVQQQVWANEDVRTSGRKLNQVVAKLRASLGDSAETPGFVETLRERGYRFLASTTQ
jgi:DNA-binding winged helix-turn-helix (wHTH) protein